MSASDAGPGESFRGLVLQVRGRIGLTQRELAARIGVHAHSVQAWESGTSYPGAASLRALIGEALRAGAFTPGKELAEASALWAAALRESPRLRVPFDRSWFATLLRPADDERPAALLEPPSPTAVLRPAPVELRRQSWGESPDVASFVGRRAERALVRRWALDDRCRLIGLLGLGGIGKTLLATRLAHDLAPHFDAVYWRSLRDAPMPSDWLAGALGFLAPDDAVPQGEGSRASRLLELVGRTRCLLVLDNVETVLRPGERVGSYVVGFEGYGGLLRQLGESAHRSCVLLTSRELPPELGPMRGEAGPVRVLDLAGLSVGDGQALLGDKRLDGDDTAWQTLVRGCGGNGLALKVVGEVIQELFGGSIEPYLAYAGATPGVMVGGVRQLLDGQVGRLSGLERELLRWLAIARDPVSFGELAADLGPGTGRGALLEAVEALRRRSLLERSERQSRFTLQSVVLEYVTEQLIEALAEELVVDEPSVLLQQPLVQATANDSVRRNQERMLAVPLLERLTATLGSTGAVERRLLGLLDRLRDRPQDEHGCGPGNLVNLLRLLRGDLRGLDLSGLSVRQAVLHEADAQDVRLTDARLAESVLAEAFNYPTSMALSADGAYLAAGTSDGEVCLWRVADRTLLATLRGHTSGVRGVALSRDGQMIASGGLDGRVCLWSATNSLPLATMHHHADAIYAVALGGDGRLAASGGMDGTLRLWETATGRPLMTLAEPGGAVWRAVLTDDGRLLAGSYRDGTIRVWETAGGRLLAEFGGFERGAAGLAFSRDGKVVAVGSTAGTVTLWESTTGRLLQTLAGHGGGVRGVALRADGRQVVSGSYDGAVRLWAVEDGRLLATMHGHAGGIWDLALSADGELLASGSFDGTVRLWETGAARTRAVLRGYNSGIRGVAASADGTLVVAGGYDGVVRLWSTESGRLLRTLTGHASGIRGVAVSADGRLVASGSFDETLRLWDAASGRELAALPGHVSGVWGVALSGDGRLAAGGGYDGTVNVWDAVTARLRWTLQGNTTDVRDVAFTHDGRLVAAACENRTVQVWNTASGQPVATLAGSEGGLWGVVLSGNGRLVAAGGDDRTARVWEIASGRQVSLLEGHTNGIWGVALTPDGQYVATASFDGTVRLWDAMTGRPLQAFSGHEGGIWGVTLSADGQTVASGGVDGTVRVWSATGEHRHTLRGDRRYERLDITGLRGVTEAQRRALLALGAVDRGRPGPYP